MEERRRSAPRGDQRWFVQDRWRLSRSGDRDGARTSQTHPAGRPSAVRPSWSTSTCVRGRAALGWGTTCRGTVDRQSSSAGGSDDGVGAVGPGAGLGSGRGAHWSARWWAARGVCWVVSFVLQSPASHRHQVEPHTFAPLLGQRLRSSSRGGRGRRRRGFSLLASGSLSW